MHYHKPSFVSKCTPHTKIEHIRIIFPPAHISKTNVKSTAATYVKSTAATHVKSTAATHVRKTDLTVALSFSKLTWRVHELMLQHFQSSSCSSSSISCIRRSASIIAEVTTEAAQKRLLNKITHIVVPHLKRPVHGGSHIRNATRPRTEVHSITRTAGHTSNCHIKNS